MNKVTIDRELLERELLSVLDFSESNLRRVVDHLIDVGYTRAAPRQPEGEGLEVVGFSWLDTAHFRRKIPVHCVDEHWVALCRLSDHQRAIAELRDMLSGEVETNIQLRQKAFDLTEQRDTLAGLLREAHSAGRSRRLTVDELYRIDAALAEVKPCAESPNPAAT